MPNINVTRSSMPDFEEYCNEIKELWQSRWLTNMGAKHRQFEADLLDYTEADNVKLFANGHLALENALAAFDFPKGAEIITTPFTFASTTHGIVRCGLTPVMCDIDPITFTMDPSKIEELITAKTAAILPVHVYGNICDDEKIGGIAKRHGLKVIYDAAHAFAAKKGGKSPAVMGDAAMFSFHATKVFHTIEGGAVFFRNEELGKKLDQLKNFGIKDGDAVACAGGNAKLNEFAAAMGICNLRHLDEEIKKREKAALRYYKNLEGVKGITLCRPQAGIKPNYAYFPVVFEGYKHTRDEVLIKLAQNNIMARKYFYPPTNAFDCYKNRPFYGAEKTPVALRIAKSVLTLPLYAGLDEEDVDKICEIILNR